MSKKRIQLSKPTRALGAWFERQKRVLPWRSEPTVYRVWISEIMLQQTQVATVIPYFERFVARFTCVEDLARAEEADVLAHWAGLGYYSRARNLQRAAKKIVEAGRFPRDREEWLEIPGVGDYTAGAILSIAQDQVEAILDGNVERVLSRVRRVSRAKGDAAFKERLWKLSRLFVTEGARAGIHPSVLNQSLMELGATICTPKKPKCLLCPLKETCRAFQSGTQEEYPPKKAPKKWLQVEERLHCVLGPRGELLLRQRAKGEWRAGLWDFPETLPRGLKVEKLGEVETRHVVTRHKVTRKTSVWRCSGSWKAADSAEDCAYRWVRPRELEGEVAAGSALKRALREVHARFSLD